jgi:hypothetical protein
LVVAASSEVWYQSIEDLLKAIETPKADKADERLNEVAAPGLLQQLLVTATPLDAGDAPTQPPCAAAPTPSSGSAATDAVAVHAAGTPAQKSTVDAELLFSLETKLKALGNTLSAMPRASLPPRGEAAFVPVSPTGTVASHPSKGPTPPPDVPSMTNSHQGMRTPTVLPPIESTQTLRPLTPLELTDGEASRWFAIQLKVSADSINAADVPSLDIFEEYKLYAVTDPHHDRPGHALRLGFFSSVVAAEAVMFYLTAYFPMSTIRRVSIAERARFADKLVTAGKDVGASGKHAFIELFGVPEPLAATRIAAEPDAVYKKPPALVAKQLWSWLLWRR